MENFEQIVTKIIAERVEGNPELMAAADKLAQIRGKIQTLLDEAADVLVECPGDIAHLSFETWMSRMDTALTDMTEYCMSCDYTMEDAINALRNWRAAA